MATGSILLFAVFLVHAFAKEIDLVLASIGADEGQRRQGQLKGEISKMAFKISIVFIRSYPGARSR
ncbi:MAG: hypothetical protein P8Z79_08315 [Sedimentisphaerales bacterium]